MGSSSFGTAWLSASSGGFTSSGEYIAKIAKEMRYLRRVQKELEFWLGYNGTVPSQRVDYIINMLEQERRKAQDRIDLWHRVIDQRNGSSSEERGAHASSS